MKKILSALSVFLLLASCSAAAPRGSEPRAPASNEQAAPQSELQAPWTEENFTDPRRHNPKSFRYLITSIIDIDTFEKADRRISFYGAGLKAPYLISASVISERRGIAYSDSVRRKDEIGFVLSVPAHLIVAAHEKDMVTKNSWKPDGSFDESKPGKDFSGPNNYEDYKNYLLTELGLPPPAELLEKSIKYYPMSKFTLHRYNEVMIEAKPEIKVTGIFFFDNHMPQVERNEDPARSKNLRRIASLISKKYKLPMLELKVPPPIK